MKCGGWQFPSCRLKEIWDDLGGTTVDGRNPAPPGMYKTMLIDNGIIYHINWCRISSINVMSVALRILNLPCCSTCKMAKELALALPIGASWFMIWYFTSQHKYSSQLMAPIPILCLFRSLNRYRYRNDKIPPQPPQPTLSLMLHGLDGSQFSRLIQECKEKPIWWKSQRAHSLLWKIDGGWQEVP